MELYQLKTFVAVAEERHLTRAAERVFTSPPAVSAQIKALEDELGVKLFERTPRGMVPTEAGARLRGEAQGVVRFGTVSDPVSLRLGNVLVTLAERHPQVTLQLHQGLSAQTLAALHRGELDCAYVMSDQTSIDGLELQRLGAVDLVVALPNALAEAHPGLTLAGLVELPWVGTGTGCVLRSHLDGLFAAAGREYREGALANTEGAVRSMVASGFGAGIVRLDQAEQAERHGELRIWPGWRGHTWLCWAAPPAARQTSAVAAVKEALLEAWA